MEVLHYNLDMTPESEWKIVSAGAFARDNLLYLQEAGHFILVQITILSERIWIPTLSS